MKNEVHDLIDMLTNDVEMHATTSISLHYGEHSVIGRSKTMGYTCSSNDPEVCIVLMMRMFLDETTLDGVSVL